MNNKNIHELLKDVVLDKFLVNFVPGVVLFYALTISMNVSTGAGLLALLVVAAVSWSLGVLIELVFFRKTFNRRWQGETSRSIDNVILMFGKTGISLLVSCLACIDMERIHDMVDNSSTGEETYELKIILRIILFCAGGILLYMMYRNQVKRND